MNNNLSGEGTLSEDLMARAAKGDNSAFEALVKRHQRAVLTLIYRFMGNRTKAEDLAQEVFIRVWQAAGRYKPTAKFSTWIYRITANLCLNELKSARRRKLLFFFLQVEKAKIRRTRTLNWTQIESPRQKIS